MASLLSRHQLEDENSTQWLDNEDIGNLVSGSRALEPRREGRPRPAGGRLAPRRSTPVTLPSYPSHVSDRSRASRSSAEGTAL